MNKEISHGSKFAGKIKITIENQYESETVFINKTASTVI
jgi:hypothetical protein